MPQEPLCECPMQTRSPQCAKSADTLNVGTLVVSKNLSSPWRMFSPDRNHVKNGLESKVPPDPPCTPLLGTSCKVKTQHVPSILALRAANKNVNGPFQLGKLIYVRNISSPGGRLQQFPAGCVFSLLVPELPWSIEINSGPRTRTEPAETASPLLTASHSCWLNRVAGGTGFPGPHVLMTFSG